MRTTFQLAGGGAGRSQANGAASRRWLASPPPQRVTPAATARAATARLALSRVRLIVQTPPSPSSGPPLLSESWSPPLSCGMPLEVDGGFFGVGDDDERPPDFDVRPASRLPVGETANHVPPNAVRPSPFVSPDVVSLTKRYSGWPS